MTLVKTCNNCGTEKDLEEFPRDKRTPDGRRGDCCECNSKYRKRLYKDNPKPKREAAVRFYYSHRSTKMARHKIYEQEIKDRVFVAYGGYMCACCGETERRFLTLDHKDGGGTQHRKEHKGGGKFTYRWCIKHDFPPLFQVLCFNCNCGRALNNGVCPHKEKKATILG